MGYANVNHQHLDAHFYSPSTWLGAMPDVPVFAVWVPVLASATPGATTSVTLNPAASQLFDSLENQYALTVEPATFTVGGTLAIENVTPAGGIVPSSTPVRIDGTGFDRGTRVSIDGASVFFTEFVSPQQVNVILNAPTELTGKHFHITNSAGEHVDYFPAFSSAPSDPPDGLANLATGVHPLVPLADCASASTWVPQGLGGSEQIALLNPGPMPVDVTFVGSYRGFGGPTPIATVLRTITIPVGTLYFLDAHSVASYNDTLFVMASAPLRMLAYVVPWYQSPGVGRLTPVAGPPPVQALDDGSISWSLQAGSPLPPAQKFTTTTGFTVSVPPGLARLLSVTPMQSATPGTLSVALLPGVSPGNYSGTLTITPVLSGAAASLPVTASTIDVSLTVSAMPLISDAVWPPATAFYLDAGAPATTNTVNLVSNGQPAAFTLSTSTSSGGNWLSVTPSSGTTPALLSVTVNPAGLAADNYDGTITVQGPGNTVEITAILIVNGPATPPPPGSGPFTVDPTSLAVSLESGTEAPDQYLFVTPITTPITLSVATQSGGNWLSATTMTAGVPDTVFVSVSAVGLAAGAYQGTVTIASPNNGTVQVPVTLTVIPVPGPQAQLTVTPSSVSLSDQVQTQTLTLGSSETPVPFSYKRSTPGGDLNIGVSVSSSSGLDGWQPMTPATVQVSASAQEPGTHAGSIVFTGPNGSVTVPVTLTTLTGGFAAGPAWPPVMATIASAANHISGAISPGEIAMILGMGIGPAPTNMQIDATGKVATTLNGTQVLINGEPAPLIYADGNLINLIVPYDIPTSLFATVRVITNGQQSAYWGVPTAPAAPGIFTLTETGLGQAAVLNADNSVNGPANPAARGAAIQIFATGEGQTSPPGITGEMTQMDLKKPVLPVKVTIGGIDAQLEYQGSAPEAVAGLLQVNAVVPAGVTPGPAVSIVLTIGNVGSPNGVTIAVQ
jgi:uncharacterized protein (TIGR03437 family)